MWAIAIASKRPPTTWTVLGKRIDVRLFRDVHLFLCDRGLIDNPIASRKLAAARCTCPKLTLDCPPDGSSYFFNHACVRCFEAINPIPRCRPGANLGLTSTMGSLIAVHTGARLECGKSDLSTTNSIGSGQLLDGFDSQPFGGNGSLPCESRSRIRPSLPWMSNSLS